MIDILYGIPDQSFLDSYWTAIHFGSGLLIGIALILYSRYQNKKIDPVTFGRNGFVLLLIWELFELSLRYMEKLELKLAEYLAIFLPRSFFEIESLINIASDLILGSIGLYLIYQYLQRRFKAKRDV